MNRNSQSFAKGVLHFILNFLPANWVQRLQPSAETLQLSFCLFQSQENTGMQVSYSGEKLRRYDIYK